MARYSTARDRRTPPHVSLAALRAVSGKTLDEVCEAASEVLPKPLTRGALSAIENGIRGASDEMLAALEVAYGLRPGQLVTDYEPHHRRREPVPA